MLRDGPQQAAPHDGDGAHMDIQVPSKAKHVGCGFKSRKGDMHPDLCGKFGGKHDGQTKDIYIHLRAPYSSNPNHP